MSFFAMRALLASGYEWPDLDETRATLLVDTSKSQMKLHPKHEASKQQVCKGQLPKLTEPAKSVFLKVHQPQFLP